MYKDKRIFKGVFKNNSKITGTIEYPDLIVYTGSFISNAYENSGSLTSETGKYNGDFK
jgi:hypothetical protein